jgi:hypothetical protein
MHLFVQRSGSNETHPTHKQVAPKDRRIDERHYFAQIFRSAALMMLAVVGASEHPHGCSTRVDA